MNEHSLSVGYLQEYIRSKDHHPESLNSYFLKLTEEIGELARAVRKDLRPASDVQIKQTVEEELWDVMYYTLALANCYDIDMERIIPLKEQINNQKYATGITLTPGN